MTQDTNKFDWGTFVFDVMKGAAHGLDSKNAGEAFLRGASIHENRRKEQEAEAQKAEDRAWQLEERAMKRENHKSRLASLNRPAKVEDHTKLDLSRWDKFFASRKERNELNKKRFANIEQEIDQASGGALYPMSDKMKERAFQYSQSAEKVTFAQDFVAFADSYENATPKAKKEIMRAMKTFGAVNGVGIQMGQDGQPVYTYNGKVYQADYESAGKFMSVVEEEAKLNHSKIMEMGKARSEHASSIMHKIQKSIPAGVEALPIANKYIHKVMSDPRLEMVSKVAHVSKRYEDTILRSRDPLADGELEAQQADAMLKRMGIKYNLNDQGEPMIDAVSFTERLNLGKTDSINPFAIQEGEKERWIKADDSFRRRILKASGLTDMMDDVVKKANLMHEDSKQKVIAAAYGKEKGKLVARDEHAEPQKVDEKAELDAEYEALVDVLDDKDIEGDKGLSRMKRHSSAYKRRFVKLAKKKQSKARATEVQAKAQEKADSRDHYLGGIR